MKRFPALVSLTSFLALLFLVAALSGCGDREARTTVKGQWDVGVSTQRSR